MEEPPSPRALQITLLPLALPKMLSRRERGTRLLGSQLRLFALLDDRCLPLLCPSCYVQLLSEGYMIHVHVHTLGTAWPKADLTRLLLDHGSSSMLCTGQR